MARIRVRGSPRWCGKILPRPRRTVGGEKAGRPEPYKRGTGARAPAWTVLQVLVALVLGVSGLLTRTRHPSPPAVPTVRFSGCLMVGSQLRFPWSVRVCLMPGSCSVFSVLAPFWHAEGTTRALVVLVPLNARGLHLARARGGHAARARRPGARRSLPRCVNQCSLPGPRLRTGEPLTSPLP